MSRQQMLIRLPLVGTVLLCLFVGVYLIAWKRSAKAGPPAKITGHAVETPAGDALKYWTADKMRDARGIPLPNVTALERGKQQRRRPARRSRPPRA